MDKQHIHETVLKDIVDVITDVRDSESLPGFIRGRNTSFSSVAKGSSNLILTFPVIASRNLTIDTACIITKALEREFVSMLEILFNSVCYTNAKDAFDYVRNFHSNLDLKEIPDMDEFGDMLNKSGVFDESFNGRVEIEGIKLIEEDMHNINYVMEDSINESSLSEFVVRTSPFNGKQTVVKEYGMDGSSNELKNSGDFGKSLLLPTDVKKANELTPTMMQVLIHTLPEDSDRSINSVIVIGVKAKLYPVSSSEILTRLSSKYSDKHGLANFFRATTREISFAKDFLFAINKAKVDAISRSRKGSSSKLWRVLERRATKSKILRSMGMANTASAITSLVLTKEDVEYLKKTEGIDLENQSVIKKIMNSYNLISFVITDDSMQIAKFLFDNDEGIFEEISYDSLERQGDDNYKKVINLMSKMQR